MCRGTLDLYCLECHQFITWRKEHTIRNDGYYDWRIVVTCGCGELADPKVMAKARAAFDMEVGRLILEGQEEAMERVLGTPFHKALNERVRSMFEWQA